MIKSYGFYFKAKSIIKKIHKSSPHAVIYFPLYHPWNYLIALAAKKRGLKVVTTVHDFVTHVGDKSTVVEYLQKKTVSLSDQVVFLTQKERSNAVETLPTIEEKSIVVRHPILSSNAKNNLEHRQPLKFLMLGRIKKYKGIDLVLDTFDSDKNYELTIAGDGVMNRKVSEKIKLINRHLTEEEVAQLLEEHHVLLLPYIDASQSGILTLGLDAEIPMIVSKLSGLQEQLSKDAALWIEPNARSLSRAMDGLSNDPELYNSLKKNLRAYRQEQEEKFALDLKKLKSVLKH